MALVELVDLFPTVCDLAGISLPAQLEGRSFVPLLDSPDQPWKNKNDVHGCFKSLPGIQMFRFADPVKILLRPKVEGYKCMRLQRYLNGRVSVEARSIRGPIWIRFQIRAKAADRVGLRAACRALPF